MPAEAYVALPALPASRCCAFGLAERRLPRASPGGVRRAVTRGEMQLPAGRKGLKDASRCSGGGGDSGNGGNGGNGGVGKLLPLFGRCSRVPRHPNCR